MKKRILLASSLLVIIFGSIGAIFWYQESQYLLPTPVPRNYHPVAIGQSITTEDQLLPYFQSGKPVFLHFFNPHCPCSRFNIEHFSSLVKTYGQQLTFIAVIQTEDDINASAHFEGKYDLHIPVVVDTNKQIAKAYGVYATPQAVLITKNNSIYYRGNYNKSRYCTNKNSNFAQMAIDSLLAGNHTPEFIELASKAYGCELPDSTQAISFINIFN
ncbi:redoxin domain-containing protein [Rhodocytophaga rosea]|uniref:Redoxin domain-containing protein n=1 Tax=Rhodocytophaga rosea TaxID=2704465 RepID=A0A6C0GLU1_9BACT|nr:redoxin domain-containing protein [Rhodocytophaga rosea]QHT68613.1 redoxin domain-containing protein [Rhodocytophaga rosea]